MCNFFSDMCLNGNILFYIIMYIDFYISFYVVICKTILIGISIYYCNITILEYISSPFARGKLIIPHFEKL